MEFHKSSTGIKLFNVQIPQLIRELKRIADNLEPVDIYIDQPQLGSFEEITKDEQEEIVKKNLDFDEWFETLVITFDLKTHYPNDLQSIKNLVRHGWNASSKIDDHTNGHQ